MRALSLVAVTAHANLVEDTLDEMIGASDGWNIC